MRNTATSRQQLPIISIVESYDPKCHSVKREIAFTISFVLCVSIFAFMLPENRERPERRFLKTAAFPVQKDSVQRGNTSTNSGRPKRRKLTLKSHYNAYPSFSYPYQQYYGAYNYMGGYGSGASYYQYPGGGMPFYQRPAVPYGGQMTSPIFNYGYQHFTPNTASNVPTQIQVPEILTMPSVGSVLGYGRSTFIQQPPEIGGSGTQSGVSGPGRGQSGPGLQGIIGSLTSEGGLLDPAFLGSLARLFLDGNMETLAISALDIITRIGEGEEIGSLLGDLTNMIFSGFLNGIIPGTGGGDNASDESGLMGDLLNMIGGLDVGELGNIELPLSPPSTVSPNILDAVLERFGLESELGAPEVVEREARNRFKSEMAPPIAQTDDGRQIALVTLDDVLNHFSPSEKLTVAKLRTVLFVRYHISNPETANEYIQFILKNEIPIIGAHIPGAPKNPTPLEFYEFAGKKSGDLTFRDIMKVLELFYDIHNPAAAESIALALEKLGIDIVGYNIGSSRERVSQIADRSTMDLAGPSNLSAGTMDLTTPPKSKSRLAYGPSNPSKDQFLALFPHPDNITTNDIREVLKFYYNVFDEETVRFVNQHMIRRWNINVN